MSLNQIIAKFPQRKRKTLRSESSKRQLKVDTNTSMIKHDDTISSNKSSQSDINEDKSEEISENGSSHRTITAMIKVLEKRLIFQSRIYKINNLKHLDFLRKS